MTQRKASQPVDRNASLLIRSIHRPAGQLSGGTAHYKRVAALGATMSESQHITSWTETDEKGQEWWCRRENIKLRPAFEVGAWIEIYGVLLERR